MTPAATILRRVLALHVAAVLWTLGAAWSFVKWLGRVTLWLVFWPLGLWRSIRHGRRKRDERLLEELRRAGL